MNIKDFECVHGYGMDMYIHAYAEPHTLFACLPMYVNKKVKYVHGPGTKKWF